MYITPSTTIGVASCPRVGIEVVVPRQPEVLDVVRVDFIERAEALLAIGPAIGHPIAGFLVGADQPGRIDLRGSRWRRGSRGGRLLGMGAVVQKSEPANRQSDCNCCEMTGLRDHRDLYLLNVEP